MKSHTIQNGGAHEIQDDSAQISQELGSPSWISVGAQLSWQEKVAGTLLTLPFGLKKISLISTA